tara:strand:+ start:783 stop:1475 length:693 start_codon:yes stop_codon:yes gene_type:complete
MTLASSGTLTLNDIQGEFGGSNPIGLNEYYRGGSLVPNHSNTSSIPTSGTIQVDDFYGTSSASPLDLSFTMTHGAANIAQGKFVFDWRGAAISSSSVTGGSVGSFSDTAVAAGGASGNIECSATQRTSGAPNATSINSFAWTIEFSSTTIRDAIKSGRSGATFPGLGFKAWETLTSSLTNQPINPATGSDKLYWGAGIAGAGVSGQLALYNQFAGWTMNRAGTTDTITFS